MNRGLYGWSQAKDQFQGFLKYQGTWKAGTSYVPHDVVTYNGHLYVANVANTANIPSQFLPQSGWSATATGPITTSSAFDGSIATRWHSNAQQASGMFFQLNLGAISLFDTVVLDCTAFPSDFPVGYTLQCGDDGSTWGSVLASGGGAATTTIQFAAQSHQYILITLTAASTGAFWSIGEYNVKNSNTSWTLMV